MPKKINIESSKIMLDLFINYSKGELLYR